MVHLLQQHAIGIINRALLLSKVLPYAQLNSAYIDPTLETWGVVANTNKHGERIGNLKLVIGEKTLTMPQEILALIAIHEAAHTAFTWFNPNGEYINNNIFSKVHNIFEDGRINKAIIKYYPQYAPQLPKLYAAMDKSENEVPYSFIGPNQCSEKVRQVEWLNRALQIMLKENGTPGSGRVAIANWSRSKEEKLFLTKSLQYYDAYSGVSPQPTWCNSRNKALHASALQFLFGFDQFCGTMFCLPKMHLEPPDLAKKICEQAEAALNYATSRLTLKHKVESVQNIKLKADFKQAKHNIDISNYGYRDIGICLAVIGLGNEADSFEHTENSIIQGTNTLISFIREAKINADKCWLAELEEIEGHILLKNYTELEQWATNKTIEVKNTPNSVATNIIKQSNSLIEKIAALGHRRKIRLNDETENIKPPNTNFDQKNNDYANHKGENIEEFGIGHDSHGVEAQIENTLPNYEPQTQLNNEELPYWIDSGEIPRSNEPEVLNEKPSQPGKAQRSNGTLEIDYNTITAYEKMIKEEFLSGVKSGVKKFREEVSKYFGRLDTREFLHNELHEGRTHKSMFRIMEESEDFSSKHGDNLAPKLILILNDFSGSMHACSKELGALSGAVFLLCQKKKTRLVLALGSHKHGIYDSTNIRQRSLGKGKIILEIEEKFNLDNGGNSPTWHQETCKAVDEVLQHYSVNPKVVRVIIGSDENILKKELEWLSTIKEKYPTIVIKDKPNKEIIREIGKFLRYTKK